MNTFLHISATQSDIEAIRLKLKKPNNYRIKYTQDIDISDQLMGFVNYMDNNIPCRFVVKDVKNSITDSFEIRIKCNEVNFIVDKNEYVLVVK
jgi:hypothetical protein